VASVKFIFNVRKDKIVLTLSKVPGARWPGFHVEEMVKIIVVQTAAVK